MRSLPTKLGTHLRSQKKTHSFRCIWRSPAAAAVGSHLRPVSPALKPCL